MSTDTELLTEPEVFFGLWMGASTAAGAALLLIGAGFLWLAVATFFSALSSTVTWVLVVAIIIVGSGAAAVALPFTVVLWISGLNLIRRHLQQAWASP